MISNIVDGRTIKAIRSILLDCVLTYAVYVPGRGWYDGYGYYL